VRHGVIDADTKSLFTTVDDPQAALAELQGRLPLHAEGASPSFARSRFAGPENGQP
jgi:hypothetical protein